MFPRIKLTNFPNSREGDFSLEKKPNFKQSLCPKGNSIFAILFWGVRFVVEVLLDGGFGVNILPESVLRELKIKFDLFLAPFQVRMADQR